MTDGPSDPAGSAQPASSKTRLKRPKGSLTTFPIVPDAEPRSTEGAPLVTSQDEQAFYAHRLREREMDIGWLGKFFGTWWTPAMIVAAFVAGMIVLLWVVTLFVDRPDMADARKYLFSGLLSVVAYIFGAATQVKGTRSRRNRDRGGGST
jgi:hypothetical protein